VYPSFGREVFEYITSLVPYWRVTDEAWPVEDDHLTGIGVERNYGGQVMVLPWSEDAKARLALLHGLLGPLSKRIVIVVDDREIEQLDPIFAIATPIVVLPWSRRSELASIIIKDSEE
jgi:hypothetical protein